MNKLVIPCLIMLGLVGCKESTLPVAGPLPTANFVITTDQTTDTTNGLITIATYDRHQLTSKATNATSYLWNFGNDTLRKEQNAVLSYPQSGTYTLTLTVQNETGQKASVSKKVRVLDRVIRQVVINAFNNVYDTTKHSANPDVWAVVKLAPNNSTYPKPTAKGVTFDAPIIFQTPVIAAIDASKLPYTFDVPGKLVLDFPALNALSINSFGYKGIGYGLELYGRDKTGTYLLSSSYEYLLAIPQSGAITYMDGGLQRNLLTFRYDNVLLICDYE